MSRSVFVAVVSCTCAGALLASAALAATVTVPAGSVDALAGAIDAAGANGTVILEAGTHTESGGVVIDAPVSIVGEPGAVLASNTTPATDYPLEVEAALYVLGTSRVSIQGLELRPADAAEGNTAILIEESSNVSIRNNVITGTDIGGALRGYQFGVLIQHGRHVEVRGNTIFTTSSWLTGEVPEAHGIVVINGAFARLSDNQVANGLFGIWACDANGRADHNTISASFVGLILCNVPDGNFLISGSTGGSERPATGWQVHSNLASGNFDAGYLVIDGANSNHLSNNAAADNGTYDIELTGDSYRFGFLTPKSYDNQVTAGSHPGLVVKDCGMDNHLTGFDQLVDNTIDPCF